MHFPLARLFRLGLALFSACVAAASAQPTDADFLAAKAAFDRNDARALNALAPRLSGYPLEPYVTFWQLRLGLESADPQAVRAFLDRERDSPLAERLRVDWLKLAGRRGDWTRFAIDYPPPGSEDVELACYGVQYRRQRDGDAALAAARPYWFTGQGTPDACDPVFEALFARGDLSAADRRARFRLATEAGNTKLALLLAADMPPNERIAPKDLAQVERDPLRALTRGEFLWNRPAGRDLALYAVERAARKDPAAARTAWVRWRVLLPEADRAYGNGRVAYHGARQLHPDANGWYREAALAPFNDDQHAWRVRAALRAQSFPDALAAVNAMPPALAQDPAWRYWRARALAAAGRNAEARPIFEALATEFSFYGLLAADALGTRIAPASNPYAPSAELFAAFGARPGVQRAVKLAQLDLRAESLREWIVAIRGADDEGLLLAAEYARRAGMYDRSINTADRTTRRHDFGLRYQMPFRDRFDAAARDNGIDESVLLAIARQESRFAPTIVSSAGAAGLMQLMPGTARWVAKQLGYRDYQGSMITDVDLNTRFGAFYFKYWLDRLDGRPELAAAAYNAGPSRAQAWRPAAPIEGAIWVETIPFNETRDYVKKVMANAMFYGQALERPGDTLTDRLAVVRPRGEAADAAIAAGAP
jgi:soluble lytic murein transglycosylase